MHYSEYDKKVLPLLLLAMILISVVLAIFLRKKSERIRSIPTAVIAVFMVFIEIIKQRWNLLGEFNYFYLPFHYCSLFLIVFPLAELCGKKLSRIFRPVAASMAFIVSVGMYVSPQGMLGTATEIFGKDFHHTHSLIFHHLLVFYVILVWALQLCKPRIRDAFTVGGIGVLYVAIALPISYKLATNYCNFLESMLPFFEAFRLSHGQIAYTVVLSLALTVGTVIGSFIYIGVSKLFAIRLRKKAH